MTQWMRVAWFEELVRTAYDDTMDGTIDGTMDDTINDRIDDTMDAGCVV